MHTRFSTVYKSKCGRASDRPWNRLPFRTASGSRKTAPGQAIDYTRNQWSTLTRYVTAARFALDNGAAERAIRPLTVGRANWLDIGGEA